MHHFIARLKCHDIYLVENLALGLTSQISKAMYVSTGKPIYMEKLTRIMFRATFLIFIFTALSASVAAIDIKTVFLNLNHPRLKESLSPQPGTASSYGELSQILEGFQIVDLKNHYMDSESSSATGTWRRTYVLYFSNEGLPIFVGSEHNRATEDKLTDFFALCQDKAGKWSECTWEIFPRLTVVDLLAPGATMDKATTDLWSFYYELPRKGTTVYLHIKYSDYAIEPDAEKLIQKNLRKFRKQKFALVWDKKNRKMVLTK
jgi:hypothetical protein